MTRHIVAVDPGPVQSAVVVWDGARVLEHFKERNDDVADWLEQRTAQTWAVVFEQVASYGMPVGAEVFETVFWTGRFFEVSNAMRRERLPRREVKLHLCGQARAKDSNIRQAILDRFGGKATAIGTKAQPGPLYGLKADTWQALALAITWWDQQHTRQEHTA